MPKALKEILIYLLRSISSNDINWDYSTEEAIDLIINKLEK